MASPLQMEFERLGQRSPWMASFRINGQVYGAGLNHEQDVRPPAFFQQVPHARRVLELGSCQGGGTFQLARHPGVEQVVALEARDYHVEKARFVQQLLGITNVTFLQANLETFDLTSLGHFDAVYCVGLLYHLPQPWELLTKLQAVTDIVYLNTHYARLSQVDMALGRYEGMKYLEGGFEDPLSGMSDWSFWPTLQALAQMVLDTGFVPEILETDTTGPGQAPHGTTILGRRAATLSAAATSALQRKMEAVLTGQVQEHMKELCQELRRVRQQDRHLAEQLTQALQEAELLRTQIHNIEASKFWKLRRLWLRVKRVVGLRGQ